MTRTFLSSYNLGDDRLRKYGELIIEFHLTFVRQQRPPLVWEAPTISRPARQGNQQPRVAGDTEPGLVLGVT